MRFILTVLAIISYLLVFSQEPVHRKAEKQNQFSQGFGLLVAPASVEFNLEPGQAITRTVNISNKIGQPRKFRVYLGDWQRDSSGRHSYHEPGTLPFSCANWSTIDKEFIELENGASTDITIRMQVPDSIEYNKSMRWAMLFIEIINETTTAMDIDNVSALVAKTYRVGVHLLQTPPNLIIRDMKMVAFEKIPGPRDSVGFKITCRNEGQVQIRCKSAMELTNLGDGTKTKVGPIEFPMFPGFARNIYFLVPPSLPKGKYSVLVVVDAGEDIPIEAAQTELELL